MSNQLQTNLDAILQDKNTNLLPENLKAGVTCLGVEGTMQPGLDTSDANATADDILVNKTAYINGEKITGTLPLFPNSRTFTVDGGVTNDTENNRIQISTINSTKQTLDSNLNMEFNGEYSDVANAVGLTPEKLVKGNTILGIEGTASTGGIDTSDATATASDILKDKTAYVNGEKITGNLMSNTSYAAINANVTNGMMLSQSSIQLTDGTSLSLDILPDITGKNILIRHYVSSKVDDMLQIGLIPFSDKFIARYSSNNDYYIRTKNESMIEVYTYRGDDMSQITDASMFTKNYASTMSAFGNAAAGTFSMYDVPINSESGSILYHKSEFTSTQRLIMDSKIDTKFIIDNSGNIIVSTDNTNIANVIGLTPDKIKAGETILGVTGTYTGETTE